MGFTTLAVLITAVWIFLVNVTDVSSTAGWAMGLAAAVLALLDLAALGGPRRVG